MMHWIRTHGGWSIAIFLFTVILSVSSFQFYAYLTNRNTQAKLQRYTREQCDQTRFFYTLINNLLDDSSPHFASPAGKPTVPGARKHFISQVHELQRATVPRYLKQGCDLRDALPKT